MLNSKAPLVLMIGGLLFAGTLQAQTDTTETTEDVACIDVDGDGFGWTGTETCLVPDFVPVAGECIDFDGDGYGWNGVESCLIPGFVPTAGACVDFDGDGFGWNGIETCFIDDQPPALDDEAGQPPVIDTPDAEAPDAPVADDSDTNAAARLAFEEQLNGIRSYGCNPGDPSFELVEVYSNGLLTWDFWLYEEPECVTRPVAASQVFGIESYVLGDPVLTADGREAFEFQTEVLQQSQQDVDNEFPAGTVGFGIIAVEQGGVLLGTTIGSTPEERPTELQDVSLVANVQPIGVRAEPASMEGLIDTWQSECLNGRVDRRVFDEQNLIETSSFYDDDDCAADRFIATRVNTWNITYGDPVTSVFGQPALRTTIELIDSQFSSLVIDSSLPAPPALTEIGLVFEDIWAVVDNELVIGTCLDKRPGNCGIGENIPDLLNFGNERRFVRQ